MAPLKDRTTGSHIMYFLAPILLKEDGNVEQVLVLITVLKERLDFDDISGCLITFLFGMIHFVGNLYILPLS